ncbi:MAG: hypothetical protein ABH879_01345 [archaeon]
MPINKGTIQGWEAFGREAIEKYAALEVERDQAQGRAGALEGLLNQFGEAYKAGTGQDPNSDPNAFIAQFAAICDSASTAMEQETTRQQFLQSMQGYSGIDIQTADQAGIDEAVGYFARLADVIRSDSMQTLPGREENSYRELFAGKANEDLGRVLDMVGHYDDGDAAGYQERLVRAQRIVKGLSVNCEGLVDVSEPVSRLQQLATDYVTRLAEVEMSVPDVVLSMDGVQPALRTAAEQALDRLDAMYQVLQNRDIGISLDPFRDATRQKREQIAAKLAQPVAASAMAPEAGAQGYEGCKE